MRPLHDVTSDAKTRQKQTKKRSLWVINEHFESVFNKVLASVVVVQSSHYEETHFVNMAINLSCDTGLAI